LKEQGATQFLEKYGGPGYSKTETRLSRIGIPVCPPPGYEPGKWDEATMGKRRKRGKHGEVLWEEG